MCACLAPVAIIRRKATRSRNHIVAVFSLVLYGLSSSREYGDSSIDVVAFVLDEKVDPSRRVQ